jgi:hypothetical protein
MSCYFRHLADIFKAAGISVTPENKKDLDRALHRLVKVEYKNCPDAWKRIKAEIAADPARKAEFATKLVAALKSIR